MRGLDMLRDLTGRLPLVGGAAGGGDDVDYDLPRKAEKTPPPLNVALGRAAYCRRASGG